MMARSIRLFGIDAKERHLPLTERSRDSANAGLVKRDQVLHRPISRGVAAIDEIQIDAGLHAFDQTVAHHMYDPTECVSQRPLVSTDVIDHGGEIIREMIPWYTQRLIPLRPAKDEMRTASETLIPDGVSRTAGESMHGHLEPGNGEFVCGDREDGERKGQDENVAELEGRTTDSAGFLTAFVDDV